jgi:hypothetical protein
VVELDLPRLLSVNWVLEIFLLSAVNKKNWLFLNFTVFFIQSKILIRYSFRICNLKKGSDPRRIPTVVLLRLPQNFT